MRRGRRVGGRLIPRRSLSPAHRTCSVQSRLARRARRSSSNTARKSTIALTEVLRPLLGVRAVRVHHLVPVPIALDELRMLHRDGRRLRVEVVARVAALVAERSRRCVGLASRELRVVDEAASPHARQSSVYRSRARLRQRTDVESTRASSRVRSARARPCGASPPNPPSGRTPARNRSRSPARRLDCASASASRPAAMHDDRRLRR